MTPFETEFNRVVGIEGRYSNDVNDSGGETMYGVTVAVARANGYLGPMRDMPKTVALAIFKRRYWDTLNLDAIAAYSPELAGELFDGAVNCGVQTAGSWLQMALNAFNLDGKLYSDVIEDGLLGPGTLAAMRTYFAYRKSDAGPVLAATVNCLQGSYYVHLSRARKKDEKFVFGWIKNRVV